MVKNKPMVTLAPKLASCWPQGVRPTGLSGRWALQHSLPHSQQWRGLSCRLPAAPTSGGLWTGASGLGTQRMGHSTVLLPVCQRLLLPGTTLAIILRTRPVPALCETIASSTVSQIPVAREQTKLEAPDSKFSTRLARRLYAVFRALYLTMVSTRVAGGWVGEGAAFVGTSRATHLCLASRDGPMLAHILQSCRLGNLNRNGARAPFAACADARAFGFVMAALLALGLEHKSVVGLVRQ